MTSKPVLYGYDASAYPRIARLMLVEKGVDHVYMRVVDWSGYEKRPGFEDLQWTSAVECRLLGDKQTCRQHGPNFAS